MSELTVLNLRKALKVWNNKEDLDGCDRYFEIYSDDSCRIHNNQSNSNIDFLHVEDMYDYIQNQVQPSMKVEFIIPSSALRKAKLGDNSELAAVISTAMSNAVKDWEKSC